MATAGIGIGVTPASADNPNTVPSASDVQPNIVGGTAPTQPYPAGAKVSLNYDAPSHNVNAWFTCGATLVFPNAIVTAAHCVTDPPAPVGSAEYAQMLARFPDMQAQGRPIPTKDKQFYVHAGSDDRTAGLRANAYVVWVDPEWDWATGPNPVNDIAVLKLDRALDLQTVPLGAGPPKPGTEVFGLGWGLTAADWSESIPTLIQEMRSTVISAAHCADALIAARDLCVENPYGTDGPCSGDSGGPLLAYDRYGVMRLYGTVSRFYGPDWCGESPYVYTSVAEFRTEIYAAARLPIPTQRKAPPAPAYTQPFEPPNP